MSARTPPRSVLSPIKSVVLEKSLSLNKTRRDVRKSCIWGALNFLILAVLLYDIANTCRLYYDVYDYAKCVIVLVMFINLFYHGAKVMILNFNSNEQILITLEQKKLLGISDTDPNFKIIDPMNVSNVQTLSHSSNGPSLLSSSTPMNMTAHSWRSLSPNDSLNYSLSSPSWSYHKISPNQNASSSFSSNSPMSNVQYRDTSGIDFIADENDLNKYLKEFEANTNIQNLNNQTQHNPNLLSSFWSHPVAKSAKDMTSFLKKCTYQLATQSPTNMNSSSPKNKTDNKSSPTASEASGLAPWAKISVDIVALTQWNENVRKWLSQTILERLVREFDRINESFERHGFVDLKIGSVGLDRLRKTAQTAHVIQFIPSLPTLIPFLEVTSNQEYLERRIRKLATGGCMSDFKWNGGTSYKGKEWDESLPTDSAIIMHLLASYLDTQLMPLPSTPDVKPFSGYYYIRCNDKLPPLDATTVLIHQVTERPSHYQVIVGDTVYEMVKGYNNLFHSILFFLYHVNRLEHGTLGRVNLGRAGVNMLWIIGQR